jgi:hypothetical protein
MIRRPFREKTYTFNEDILKLRRCVRFIKGRRPGLSYREDRLLPTTPSEYALATASHSDIVAISWLLWFISYLYYTLYGILHTI